MVNAFRVSKVFWHLVRHWNKELKVLQLDVTSDCNLRCKTCYFFKDDGKHHQADDMSNDEIKKLFVQYRKKKVDSVWLYGGEPTLRMDIIEMAHRYFPLVTIISNGIIKVPETFNNSSIHISLDGLNEDNDIIRGPGSFQKIIDNYTGDSRVIFNVTVTKKNYFKLDEIIKYAKSLKIRGIEFQLYSKSRIYSKLDHELILDKSDLQKLTEMLSKYHLDTFVYATKELLNSWQNTTFTKDCGLNKLMNAYASDGNRKYCCTPGIACEDCKIFPPHLVEIFNNNFSFITAYKFLRWL
ncbi:MAG: radical SAM protein [Leptospirales bacterium]